VKDELEKLKAENAKLNKVAVSLLKSRDAAVADANNVRELLKRAMTFVDDWLLMNPVCLTADKDEAKAICERANELGLFG